MRKLVSLHADELYRTGIVKNRALYLLSNFRRDSQVYAMPFTDLLDASVVQVANSYGGFEAKRHVAHQMITDLQ